MAKLARMMFCEDLFYISRLYLNSFENQKEKAKLYSRKTHPPNIGSCVADHTHIAYGHKYQSPLSESIDHNHQFFLYILYECI